MKKIYKVIFSDYKGNCFMEHIPANNKKEVIAQYGGNGEIEKIEEVDYPIYVDWLADELKKAGYGKIEIDIICRTLTSTIPTR